MRDLARAQALLAPPPEGPLLFDEIDAAGAMSLLRGADGPSHVRTWAQAVDHLKRGDTQIARDLLQSEGESGLPAEWSSRYALLRAEIARRAGRRLEAQAAYDTLERGARMGARARLFAADLALDEARWVDANRKLSVLLTQFPRNSAVRLRAGLVAEGQGDLVAAEAHYRQAASRAKADVAPLLNLGRVQQAMGQVSDAERTFARALALSPADEKALLGRGLALFEIGRFDDAETVLRRAGEVDPSRSDALTALGDIARARGAHDALVEAAGWYRKALARQPKDTTALCKLGITYAQRGQHPMALQAFSRAHRLEPSLAAAQNGRGSSLLHLGRMREAEIALRDATRLDPSDANPLFNLALVHEVDGRSAMAKATLAEANALSAQSGGLERPWHAMRALAHRLADEHRPSVALRKGATGPVTADAK